MSKDNDNKCKICGGDSIKVFNKTILNKYHADFLQCQNCDFIQTEEPYWLDEAYKTPLNVSDTGLIGRNIYLSKIASLLIFFYFRKHGEFLDYAGGYGVFVRLMRDIGYNFFWHDLYAENLFAKGFEWDSHNSRKIELLTTFESFEHFRNPSEELEKMLLISDNILFSLELIPQSDVENWWYVSAHHGQHISLFSKKSLECLADKYNLHLYTNDVNLHLLTKSKKSVDVKRIQFFARMKFDLFVKIGLDSKTKEDSNLFIANEFI
jgi:hypothetical protein